MTNHTLIGCSKHRGRAKRPGSWAAQRWRGKVVRLPRPDSGGTDDTRSREGKIDDNEGKYEIARNKEGGLPPAARA